MYIQVPIKCEGNFEIQGRWKFTTHGTACEKISQGIPLVIQNLRNIRQRRTCIYNFFLSKGR